MAQKGFTLAEVLITLTVIGIITAVIIPVAIHSKPDENIMKFKKAHNTLYQVISELVNSDKYYLNGDLATKADGVQIKGGFGYDGGTATNDMTLIKYFCNTFASLLTTKSINCSTAKTAENDYITFVPVPTIMRDNWDKNMANGKTMLDEKCKEIASKVGAEIVTTDNIVYYQSNPQGTFGVEWYTYLLFHETDDNGIEKNYKPFCIDIDGIDKGEDPFGYGIRADGKILTGKRADEWLEKSIQGEN